MLVSQRSKHLIKPGGRLVFISKKTGSAVPTSEANPTPQMYECIIQAPHTGLVLEWTDSVHCQVAGGGLSILGAEGANAIHPGTVAHFTAHQFLAVCLSSGAVAVFMFWRTPAGKLPSIDTENGSTPLPLK